MQARAGMLEEVRAQQRNDYRQIRKKAVGQEYLEFKDDEVCEYTPDIVSDFCQKKGIDENEKLRRRKQNI